jgi:hypothetical protein
MMFHRIALLALAVGALSGQDSPEKSVVPAAPKTYVVERGTRIPLSLINSVSTKNAAEGDRVYLESAFPITANGRIVIPPGSYVTGTVTQVKRPGRVKGRAELYLRFDSLMLPNGVTREFKSRLGSVDGHAGEEFDRREGKIKSEGDKAGDAQRVGEAAAAGASIGAIAARSAGGAGLGAAAGAAAGLAGVLLSRGPDAVLPRGTTVEMVLDRMLEYNDSELEFGPQTRRPIVDSGPSSPKKERGSPLGRRIAASQNDQ